jgi:hypothetical protein
MQRTWNQEPRTKDPRHNDLKKRAKRFSLQLPACLFAESPADPTRGGAGAVVGDE